MWTPNSSFPLSWRHPLFLSNILPKNHHLKENCQRWKQALGLFFGCKFTKAQPFGSGGESSPSPRRSLDAGREVGNFPINHGFYVFRFTRCLIMTRFCWMTCGSSMMLLWPLDYGLPSFDLHQNLYFSAVIWHHLPDLSSALLTWEALEQIVA